MATIGNLGALRLVLGESVESQKNKVQSHLDNLCSKWISLSPFVVISSHGNSGSVDVSPKGGEPGFTKVIDEKTLLIPDYIGNRRADTFTNVLETGQVGLMFMAPPASEVVRVSGTAEITTSHMLLKQCIDLGRIPKLAMVVKVNEAFFHCGKAVLRSKLWQQDTWPDRSALPSYAESLKKHAQMDEPLDQISADITKHHASLY